MKVVSKEVLRAINKLNRNDKTKVEAIVRDHVQACRNLGVEIESIDRAYIEAIDVMEMEKRYPEPVETAEEKRLRGLPAQSYGQYTSPRAQEV